MTVTPETPVRLTQFAHGGGCACKIPPGELEDVLGSLAAPLAPPTDTPLLVGTATGDDAAVV
ncbi:selenide, water dikinase SelD, partial [Streptomyces sp. SID5998]|nr:selenide, water dikinase SelD [Streptomyces sp. SID5998]